MAKLSVGLHALQALVVTLNAPPSVQRTKCNSLRAGH
jgi:hypothetical protein